MSLKSRFLYLADNLCTIGTLIPKKISPSPYSPFPVLKYFYECSAYIGFAIDFISFSNKLNIRKMRKIKYKNVKINYA